MINNNIWGTNMSEFKVGTIVKLKSGGPEMTICGFYQSSTNNRYIETEQGDNVKCQWFAGKKLEYGFFPIESLEIITTEENS